MGALTGSRRDFGGGGLDGRTVLALQRRCAGADRGGRPPDLARTRPALGPDWPPGLPKPAALP
jgi:hypothetical protein